jgi:hypothetical protein
MRQTNEFLKTVAGKIYVASIENKKALENDVIFGQSAVRKLASEDETRTNQPPPAKPKPPVFVAQGKEEIEKPPEKMPTGLRKTPPAAKEPSIEPKKTGDVSAPAKIEFEAARTEKEFEKPAQKARQAVEDIIKPAAAEKIFEDFFEDFETAGEFVFQTRFGGVFYDEAEIIDLEGFRQVVVRACFDCLDGHAFGAVGRDYDHERRVTICAFYLAQEIETAHAGQINVEQDQVGFGLFEESAGGFGGAGFGDVVAEGSQGSPHAVTGGFFVVNNH